MSYINYGPVIDYQLCSSCGNCYEHCPLDIFGWGEKREIPTVDYPGECSFCCVCEIVCPEKAIDVRFAMHTRLDFVEFPDKKNWTDI